MYLFAVYRRESAARKGVFLEPEGPKKMGSLCLCVRLTGLSFLGLMRGLGFLNFRDYVAEGLELRMWRLEFG